MRSSSYGVIAVFIFFMMSAMSAKGDETGPNLTYTLEGGKLTIKGTGPMNDFSQYGAPWYDKHDQIESIEFEKGVTYIGNFSFYQNSATSVTIPDTVITIGERAFSHCASLKSVVIPDSVQNIRANSFRGCHNLTKLVISNSLKNIDEYSFYDCPGLTNVYIPNSVVEIGDLSFAECEGLENIIISGSVTTIGTNAFLHCSNLTTLFYLGSSPVSSSFDFNNCEHLANVCVPPDYSSTEFGGKSVTSDTPVCRPYVSSFNHCYAGEYVNGKFVSVKRKNATEWEQKTNGCSTYLCVNEVGPVCWSMCNSTFNDPKICIFGEERKCESVDPYRGSYQVIVIELPKKYPLSSINMSEQIEILSRAFSIDPDDIMMELELEYPSAPDFVRIILDLKNKADIIFTALDDAKNDPNCPYGPFFCNIKSIKVKSGDFSWSGAHNVHTNSVMMTVMLLFVVLAVVFM